MRHYCEVWQKLINIEQSVEQLKDKLHARPLFDIDSAFRSVDQTFTGFISYTDVSATSS